jgi:hypothetical protein
MDLRELCFHLRHRRRMYVSDDRFLTVIAFVEGYNAALGGEPLSRFQTYVTDRVLGRYSNLHWSAIIASEELRTATESDSDLNSLPPETQLSLIHRLVGLLEEYESHRQDA